MKVVISTKCVWWESEVYEITIEEGKVMIINMTVWQYNMTVMIWPLCVVDIEVFTDEEAKRAKGAKDEQQEGREELSFFC